MKTIAEISVKDILLFGSKWPLNEKGNYALNVRFDVEPHIDWNEEILDKLSDLFINVFDEPINRAEYSKEFIENYNSQVEKIWEEIMQKLPNIENIESRDSLILHKFVELVEMLNSSFRLTSESPPLWTPEHKNKIIENPKLLFNLTDFHELKPQDFVKLNEDQTSLFKEAIEKWSNVANINFAFDDSNPHQLTGFSLPDDSTYFGSSGITFNICNKLSLDVKNEFQHDPVNILMDKKIMNETNPRALPTLIHELGHALLLKHPHNEKGEDNSLSHQYKQKIDHKVMTVMSYNEVRGLNTDVTQIQNEGIDYSKIPIEKYIVTDFEATTPMPLDIIAVQELYGANHEYAKGDDHYIFSGLTYKMKTIYDTGGNDTLEFTHKSPITLVSLVPQHGLEAITEGELLHIFYNQTIENVKIQEGNSFVIGNNADNSLISNGTGSKLFIPLKGTDYLEGGTDQNYYIFREGDGEKTISAFGPEDRIDLVIPSFGYSCLSDLAITYNEKNEAIIDLSENGLKIIIQNNHSFLDFDHIKINEVFTQGLPSWMSSPDYPEKILLSDDAHYYSFFEALDNCEEYGALQHVCKDYQDLLFGYLLHLDTH